MWSSTSLVSFVKQLPNWLSLTCQGWLSPCARSLLSVRDIENAQHFRTFAVDPERLSKWDSFEMDLIHFCWSQGLPVYCTCIHSRVWLKWYLCPTEKFVWLGIFVATASKVARLRRLSCGLSRTWMFEALSMDLSGPSGFAHSKSLEVKSWSLPGPGRDELERPGVNPKRASFPHMEGHNDEKHSPRSSSMCKSVFMFCIYGAASAISWVGSLSILQICPIIFPTCRTTSQSWRSTWTSQQWLLLALVGPWWIIHLPRWKRSSLLAQFTHGTDPGRPDVQTSWVSSAVPSGCIMMYVSI